MKKYRTIIFLILLISCNSKRIEIRADKLEGNQIFYTILNNSKSDIEFLRPKKYLCYADSLSLKNKYAILSLIQKTDSGSYNIYGGAIAPNFEEEKAIEDYLKDVRDYKREINYEIITVKKGSSFSDSLLIPSDIDSPCNLYPKINHRTVLNLSGGESNIDLDSKYISETPQYGQLNPVNIDDNE